jgi:hypothetical protein
MYSTDPRGRPRRATRQPTRRRWSDRLDGDGLRFPRGSETGSCSRSDSDQAGHSSNRRSPEIRRNGSAVVSRDRQRSATGSARAGRDRAAAGPGHAEADRLARTVWEREMRRLRAGNRLLLAVLVALAARVAISGLTFASGLSLAVAGVLLLASLLLTRHGRRLAPARAAPSGDATKFPPAAAAAGRGAGSRRARRGDRRSQASCPAGGPES